MAEEPPNSGTRTLGVWAVKENSEVVQRLAEEMRVQRGLKRAISRRQCERQEAKYRERLAEALYEYLDFARKNEKLARDIANSLAWHTTEVPSEQVGRTSKLPLEENAMLATRARIQHDDAKYEDRLVNSESLLERSDWLIPRDRVLGG